ncbi:MAG: ribosome hibernation-promoting factor, HPF/YfiA family [Streptosporangiaceae bacterium]
MDIIFKGRHTDVQERFRRHAMAKLTKIEKLDQRAIRIDVEICAERNPRQSDRKERVELTITSRGPAIRAEAAAEDRYAALDLALAKLENRLRRAGDRRKARHGAHGTVRLTSMAGDLTGWPAGPGEGAEAVNGSQPLVQGAQPGAGTPNSAESDDVVPIEMQGDGPLVVREKFHAARPMPIDEALLEMELVGHDFFLFRDAADGLPSVVYRRRGYQYGVIRLVEEAKDGAAANPPAVPAAASGQVPGGLAGG